jgi:hypothetical protein
VPKNDPLNGSFYATTTAPIAQGAAGTTSIVVGVAGKKIYVTGLFLTLDAAGTAKFTEVAGDLTGAMSAGGASAPSLTVFGHRPIIWTTTAGEDLKITSATGKAAGWVRYFFAP